jgi:predicted nucleic acid-binding protein
MGLADRFYRKTLFIDTAPLIYFIEGQSPFQESLHDIFKANKAGQLHFITSTLTLLEVLVFPLRLKKNELADKYEKLITTSQNIVIVDLDTSVSKRAAGMRAKYSLKTPDAIQVATAIEKGADYLLTNDSDFVRVSEIDILLINEL